MEVEDFEIIDFLKSTPPIDIATDLQLNLLLENVQTAYRKRGHILTLKPQFLYLVRKGAVLVEDDQEKIFSIYEKKEWFGYNEQLIIHTHSCKEDTLYYRIPKQIFFEMFADTKAINNFFIDANFKDSIKAQNIIKQDSLLDNSVLSMSRANDAFVVDVSATINEVAKLMSKENITSVLITKNTKLFGIVTDRAFCTKVVAQGIDSSTSIEDIITKEPISIAHHKNGVEAMLLMAKSRIRHLPIIKNNNIVGMITAADLLRKQSHNVIFLINEVLVAKNISELVKISKQIPRLLQHSYESHMDEHNITYSVSSVGRSINQQLLKQAHDLLGEPPIAYAWVVAGSLARSEQNAHSDQDNILILSDEYQEKIHGEYFSKLAKYVCDGLNECGYIYCPGDVMATNEKWRQSVSVWRSYFNNWVNEPSPQALMYASIFFDLKCVYGDPSLLNDLLDGLLEKANKNRIFQAHMANNAQHYTPPLGFFRNLILDKNESDQKSLDLKKKGVVPIIDFARVYALSNKIKSINTQDRLQELADKKVLSEQGMHNLIEAYKFINSIRIKHQTQQIKSGKDIDNFVSIKEISLLDKKHLKDAFGVVADLQNIMRSQYQSSIL